MSKKNDGNEFERDNLDDSGVVKHDFKKAARERSYADDVHTTKDKLKDKLSKQPSKADFHEAAQNLSEEGSSLSSNEATEQIQQQEQTYNEQRIEHYQNEDQSHLTRDESGNLISQNDAIRNNKRTDKFNQISETNSLILQSEEHASENVLNKPDNDIFKTQNHFEQSHNIKQNYDMATGNVVNRHENNLRPENNTKESVLRETNNNNPFQERNYTVQNNNIKQNDNMAGKADSVQSGKTQLNPANENKKVLPEAQANKNVLDKPNDNIVQEKNHSTKNNSIKQNADTALNERNNNILKEQSNSQQTEGDYSSSLREKLINYYHDEKKLSMSAAKKQANKDLRKINRNQAKELNKLEGRLISHFASERGLSESQARELAQGILPQNKGSIYKAIKVDEKLVSKYIDQGMTKEQALNAAQRETLISNKIKKGMSRQDAIKQVDKQAQKSIDSANKDKLISYYMQQKGLNFNEATKQANIDLNTSKRVRNDDIRATKERMISHLVKEKKMSLSEAKKKVNEMLPAGKNLKERKAKKDDKKAKKVNSNFLGKLVKGVSIASTMLSVDKDKDAMENILANAGTVITIELRKWVKDNVKKFGEKAVKKMLIDGYVKKGLSKTAAKKMANKALKSVLKSSSSVLSAFSTVSSLVKGDIVGAGKDAIMAAVAGNPTQLIVLGVILVALVLLGCMMAFGNASDSGNSHSGNSYNYVEPLRNFEDEQNSEEENEEDPTYSATALKNINNVYVYLNDVFNGDATEGKAYLSSEALKKFKRSATLLSDLAAVMVRPYNGFSYNIFDDDFIKYFFGKVTDDELKEKVKTDVKDYKIKKLIFNESVEDEEQYGLLNSYNTFKTQLDKYKDKLQKIKTEDSETFRTEIKAPYEEAVREDYRTLIKNEYLEKDPPEEISGQALEIEVESRLADGKLDEERQKKLSNAQLEAKVKEKVIEKFKEEVGSNNILYLGTLELVVPDKRNIKISEEFTGKTEKDWQEFRELIGLLYYVNYIDDIPENRAINLNDYTAIINSLVDQIARLNATLVYKKSDNTEAQISYSYGSSLVETSLLLEEKFLISYNKIYDNLIAKLSDSESEDTGDYENNTIVKNLKILKEEIGKLSNETKIGSAIVNPTKVVKNDEGEEEIVEDENRLSKSYKAFSSQKTEIFGSSNFSIDKVDSYSRIIKKGEIAIGLNEIDATSFDKDFYFLTADVSKEEAITRIDSLLNFIEQAKVNIQNAKTANAESIKKVQADIKNYSPKTYNHDSESYIYPDTKLDDIPEYTQNKINVGGKDYFYVEDASEVEGIKLEYRGIDFINWFKGSDFYNKYFSDSSDYALEEDFLEEKNWLYAFVQIFEPVVNHKWESSIRNNFKKNVGYVYEAMFPFSEFDTNIPFTVWNDDFIQLGIAEGEDVYAICSGVVVDKNADSVKIECKNDKELAGAENAKPLFDEADTTFYVEYKNLSPSVKVNDKVFRYSVPNEHFSDAKESQSIGKAISSKPLEVKCYFKDGTLINPLLIMTGDEELPDSSFVPTPTPTPTPTPIPTPTPTPTPTPSPTPTPVPTPEPKVLFADLLGVVALILKVAGRIYAVWAIIKFALGLHDYESANYQAIWQFIGASVLIFGAMLLEYVSKLK